MWGIHVWIQVEHLDCAIRVANSFLSARERVAYYARLNDPAKHAAVLAEMIPGSHTRPALRARFEVGGLGVGNRTVDWVIDDPGGPILLDVKSRTADLVAQMSAWDGAAPIAQPQHSATLLFRSVEEKFAQANPAERLQGVWITTHIKQDEAAVNAAFEALNPDKVHFTILGDWRPDVYMIARRDVDRARLVSVFNIAPSMRFTFT